MDTATIFIHEQRARSGQEPRIGVRFDTQIIPTGCYVAAFLTREQALNAEIFKPVENPRQEAWNAAVKYAQDVLAGRWESDSDYPEML